MDCIGKFLCDRPPESILPITAGGSDRQFFRITSDDCSYIFCHTPDAEEYRRYCELGSFLHGKGISVPGILHTDAAQHLIFIEDAGALSLQEFVRDHLAGLGSSVPQNPDRSADAANIPVSNEQAGSAAVIEIYRDVMDELLRLHTLSYHPSAIIAERRFDQRDFLWEYTYFRDNVLLSHCTLKPPLIEQIEQEWNPVSHILSTVPVRPMHRDFQSQNILLRKGGIRILDFQGARLGLPWYDVASLLEDPYVNLPESIRRELLSYYLERALAEGILDEMPTAHDDEKGDDAFPSHALPCDAIPFDESPQHIAQSSRENTFLQFYRWTAISRLMQAAGAFSFLGHKKGKKAFLRYIPVGVQRLHTMLQMGSDLHHLRKATADALEMLDAYRR
jgi:hypothetical protein